MVTKYGRRLLTLRVSNFSDSDPESAFNSPTTVKRRICVGDRLGVQIEGEVEQAITIPRVSGIGTTQR